MISPAIEDLVVSPQLAACLRPAVLPRSLTPPSREETVGPRRLLSRPILASGEAVGPLQAVSVTPTRTPKI